MANYCFNMNWEVSEKSFKDYTEQNTEAVSPYLLHDDLKCKNMMILSTSYLKLTHLDIYRSMEGG